MDGEGRYGHLIGTVFPPHFCGCAATFAGTGGGLDTGCRRSILQALLSNGMIPAWASIRMMCAMEKEEGESPHDLCSVYNRANGPVAGIVLPVHPLRMRQ